MKAGKSFHIGLFGTFDYKNYGDLLFPDVFRHEIGKQFPEARVSLFSPVGGQKPFSDSERVYPIRDIGRVHADHPFDVLVVGGGDLIRMDEAFVCDPGKYPNAMRPSAAWIVPILFGRFGRIPVLFNAPGVPFPFSENCRPLVRLLLSGVSERNVRDDASRNLLSEAVSDLPVEVVPDTAALYGDHPDAIAANASFPDTAVRLGLPPRYAIFQTSGIEYGRTEEDYADALVRLAARTGVPVVLLPVGYVHSDPEVLSRIAKASDSRLPFVREELSPAEMFSVIGHAQWFVGTSMHGCLTAMQQDVPAVSVNPGRVTKLDGCMTLHGMEDNIVRRLEDVVPDMLVRHVDPSRVEDIRNRVRLHFARLCDEIRKPAVPPSSVADAELLSVLSSYVRDSLPMALHSQVYFDTGDGFSETNVFPLESSDEGGAFTIGATVPIPSGCRTIRVDPAEGIPLCVEEAIFRAGGGIPIPSVSENGVPVDGRIVFPSTDPQFVLEPPPDCGELVLRIRFVPATYADIGRAFERICSSRDEAIHDRNAARIDAEDANRRIEAMCSSLSWRITHPLRRLSDMFHAVGDGRFRSVDHEKNQRTEASPSSVGRVASSQ